MKKNIIFISILTLACAAISCQSDKKVEAKSLPQTVKSEQKTESSLVGKWEFQDLQGELILLNAGNTNQINETKKMMMGSTIEFKSDGKTVSYDAMSKSEYNGDYRIENGKLIMENAAIAGTLDYKIEGDILTFIWKKDDYYNQIVKVSQGNLTLESVKEFVKASDLTYTAKKIN